MNKKSYKYGQTIIKEGEIPQQAYMIYKGQCKVVMQSIGERRVFDNRKTANNIHNGSKSTVASKENRQVLRNKNTIWNRIFAQDDLIGQTSFHFPEDQKAFISYAKAPKS